MMVGHLAAQMGAPRVVLSADWTGAPKVEMKVVERAELTAEQRAVTRVVSRV